MILSLKTCNGTENIWVTLKVFSHLIAEVNLGMRVLLYVETSRPWYGAGLSSPQGETNLGSGPRWRKPSLICPFRSPPASPQATPAIRPSESELLHIVETNLWECILTYGPDKANKKRSLKCSFLFRIFKGTSMKKALLRALDNLSHTHPHPKKCKV